MPQPSTTTFYERIKVAEGAPFATTVTLLAEGGTLSATTVVIDGGDKAYAVLTVTPSNAGHMSGNELNDGRLAPRFQQAGRPSLAGARGAEHINVYQRNRAAYVRRVALRTEMHSQR